MDSNGSVIQSPGAPAHWSPPSHVDALSEGNSQVSMPNHTSILRSVEDNGDVIANDTAEIGGDDDDVQILFSVPRRRRKNRKSLHRDSLRSTAVHNNQIQHHDGNFLAPSRFEQNHHMQRSVPLGEPQHPYQQTPRRIPTDEIYFSPFPTSMHRSNHDYQPAIYHSPYGGNQSSEFSSLPTSWWEPSPARTFSNPVHDVDWRVQHGNSGIGSKRRHYGDWEMPPTQYNRHSMQISPRTNPAQNFAQISPPNGTNYNPPDMYARSYHGPPSQRWPSFDLNAFNDANTTSFSQSLQQTAIPSEPPVSSIISIQNQAGMSAQEISRGGPGVIHQTGCPLATVNNSEQSQRFSSSNIGSSNNNSLQNVASIPPPEASHPQSVLHAIPPSIPPLKDQFQAQQIPSSHTFVSGQQSQNLQRTQNSVPVTRAPDIARRPSLYKVPAWSPSLASNAPVSSSVNPQSTNLQLSVGTPVATSHTNNPLSTGTGTHSGGISRPGEQQPPKSDTVSAKDGDFQVPTAKAGRKHSPNLIVDIAETCQDVFPFVSVAERHGVSLKRVYDTFAAIIQLPLLRNADDRRRHGSLGKNRLREFKDAMKAQERAKEAERKAQKKAMMAKADETAKNAKEVAGVVSGLKMNEPEILGISNAVGVENAAAVLGKESVPGNGTLDNAVSASGGAGGLGTTTGV